MMRKAALILSLACIWAAQAALADDTDLGKYDHAFYVQPATAEAGSQCVLSINLKNTTEITSFQFDLAIPAGMSFARDELGLVDAELSEQRTTKKKTTLFDYEVQAWGALRFICGTTTLNPQTGEMYTFDGDDGEICRVRINVPATVAPGRYPLCISNVVLVHVDNTSVYVSDTIKTTLTVTRAFDGIVLDESQTAPPVLADTTANVLVRMSMKANRLATVCLPFSLSGQQTADIFGDGAMIGEYEGWEEEYASDEDENPSSITVRLTQIPLSGGIEANHPYVIRPTKDIASFEVDGVAISVGDDLSVSSGSRRRGTLGSMTGVYAASTVPEAGLYFEDDMLHYSYGTTQLKAFHAYFDLMHALQAYYDGESVGATAATAPVVFYDHNGKYVGIPRAIKAVESKYVYSLDGVLVSRNGLNGLPSGIYITNGRKVLSK